MKELLEKIKNKYEELEQEGSLVTIFIIIVILSGILSGVYYIKNTTKESYITYGTIIDKEEEHYKKYYVVTDSEGGTVHKTEEVDRYWITVDVDNENVVFREDNYTIFKTHNVNDKIKVKAIQWYWKKEYVRTTYWITQ